MPPPMPITLPITAHDPLPAKAAIAKLNCAIFAKYLPGSAIFPNKNTTQTRTQHQNIHPINEHQPRNTHKTHPKTKYNIPLIEDGACAIGSSENNLKCGNIADITCFSFHPRKVITTGEGGMITTDDDEKAEKCYS